MKDNTRSTIKVYSIMLLLRRVDYLPCLVILLLCKATFGEDFLDENDVKDKWLPRLQQSLHNFSQNILAADKIQNEIKKHVQKDVFYQISKDKESREFSNIFSNISQRFDDVRSALTKFKDKMEEEVKNIENGAPHMNSPLRECCKVNSSTYVGRFRENVLLNYECVGTKDGSKFDKVKARTAFGVMKENYNNVSSILWQYFSTTDGHFVQYPSRKRHCDLNNQIISPLTQEWFIDNLFREKKNLVILYDIGVSTTSKASSTIPMSKGYFIRSAVKRLLGTLTPDDRVNVVAFNDHTYVPTRCDNRLLKANQRNVDYIKQKFIPLGDSRHTGGSNYAKAFEKAYDLLIAEKREHPNITSSEDTIILITDGETSPDFNKTQMYYQILNGLKQMQGGVRHFVYVLQSSPKVDSPISKVLKNVAKQNFPEWQGISDVNSYKDLISTQGSFSLITNPGEFIPSVAKYYALLPYTTETDITVIGPSSDVVTGLILTLTTPVYHNNSKQVYGVAAVEASLASVFREIVNFWIGVHSYAFVMENLYGHVLLHPKLMDSAETQFEDPVFPPFEALEPTFTAEQKQKLMSADESVHVFDANVQPGRSSYESTTNKALPEQDATVFYARVYRTKFVVVMVLFDIDREMIIPKNGTKGTYYGPYHRIDETLGSPSSNRPREETVCSLYKTHVVPNESVIKLAPTAFVTPEVYKYSDEPIRDIHEVNEFLVNHRDTSLIIPDLKKEIQHVLRATNSTDQFWRPSAKVAIERFLGTTSGVFRIFPGVQLYNTYNHVNYQWYKKAVSRPTDLIFLTGKATQVSRKNYVIISKALSENVPGTNLVDILQGVVGGTITHRQLTAIMVNNVAPCSGGDMECHLVDDNGYLLNYGDDFLGIYHQHLVHSFPWLANELIQNHIMKPVWCTSMSEGRHSLSYSLDLSVESSVSKTNKCNSYVIAQVPGTNLYLLALYNRTKNNCIETSTHACGSCFSPASTVNCEHCVGNYTNALYCQCPCSCLSDFDLCTSQFVDSGSQQFPHLACYEEPYYHAPQHPVLGPHKEPGPNIKPCPIPCAVVEEISKCEILEHCEWKTDDLYPTCVWKSDSEIKNYSDSFTTKVMPSTLPTPNVPPKTNSSTLTQQSVQVPTRNPSGGTSSGINMSTPKSTAVNTGRHSYNASTTVLPQSGTSHKVDTGPSEQTVKPPQLKTSAISNIPTHSETKAPGHTSSPTSANLPATHSQSTTPANYHSSDKPNLASNNSQTATDKKNVTGLVVGLVLAGLVLILIVSFIVYKIYGKKFRQAAAESTASKYVRRKSLFDGAAFTSRTGDAVLISSPPQNIPYQSMTNSD